MAIAERLPFLPAEIIGNPGSPAIVRSVDKVNIPPKPEIYYDQRSSSFRTTREAINAIWNGKVSSIWIRVEGESGRVLTGPIQIMGQDTTAKGWLPESDLFIGWIHVLPGDPYAFRGIFFIHRDKISNIFGTSGPKSIEICDDDDHSHPVLKAIFGVNRIVKAEEFDDPGDALVREVTGSFKTLVISSCDPPGCQGNCFQRKVYYAWASLP